MFSLYVNQIHFRELRKNRAANTTTNTAMAIKTRRVTVIGTSFLVSSLRSHVLEGGTLIRPIEIVQR
jgi:hypothetical protein